MSRLAAALQSFDADLSVEGFTERAKQIKCETEWVSIDVELDGKDLKNIDRILEGRFYVQEAKLFVKVKRK